MKKTISVLVVLLLAQGLFVTGRSHGEEKNQIDNFIEQQKAGLALQLVEKKIVVKALAPNYPGEKAGIMAGDVVLTVDGQSFPGVMDVVNYIGSRKKGEKVVIVVERNGEKHTFKIEPATIRIRPTLLKLQTQLFEGRKVALAVVVSDVKTTFDMKPEVYESWVQGIRNDVQSDMESFYLRNCGANKNFGIVDRSRTKAILEEFRLNQTGLVSDTMRVKIGEMTGATHLLDISFARFRAAAGYHDDVNVRLIDIGSGAVLAVDQMKFIQTRK
jgi:membrane-associated protease RseP (regulator of RpoE activity)